MDIINYIWKKKEFKDNFYKTFYQNDTCIIFDYFSLFITFTTK